MYVTCIFKNSAFMLYILQQLDLKNKMNFFKKMLGFSAGLSEQIKNTSINGTLYRIIKDARNIILQQCTITFEKQQNDDQYLIKFNGKTNGQQDRQYAFPVHDSMELVSFNMNKGGKMNSCFQWCLDQTKQHIGCYMSPNDKIRFKQIITQIIKVVLNDELIKDHMKLCKQLDGIPVYKQSSESKISSVSSKVSSKAVESQLNEILLKQAVKQENKMVHSAILYQTVEKQRKLVNQSCIFVIKLKDKFLYELQLINVTGYTFLRKQINPALVYQVNTEVGYLKWLNLSQSQKSIIYEVNYHNKRDVALSVRFAILECLYEFNSKRKLTDAIAQDQISYLKRVGDYELNDKKVVKQYHHEKDIQQIKQSKFFYHSEEAEKGLQKYRTFCQAKINNFDLASLGSLLQTLRISDQNQIKQIAKRKIPEYKQESIKIDSILLGDKDSKAMLNDDFGTLHYYDIQEGNIVNSYELSRKGIKDIVPQYKLADATDFKTYKAVSTNTIYEIDPRTKQGTVNLKSYQTSPDFNKISVDTKGRFACSSTNGQIRLFPQVGKNAYCKYPGFGDPVLHLQSTKDGRWLLATFKKYLLLIPTQTQDEISLYEQKIKINDRPQPIRLKIKMQHLQLCGVQDYQMVPAKFDESTYTKQMFIVSGFSEYAVIWNLSKIMKGKIDDYKFTKVQGKLVQTQFMYDNIQKMIMTTQNGISVKDNKTKI